MMSVSKCAPTSPTPTIFTSYFPFPHAKHSLAKYRDWQQRFVASFTTPMMIATTVAFCPTLASYRYSDLFQNSTEAAFTLDTVNRVHVVALPLRAGRTSTANSLDTKW